MFKPHYLPYLKGKEVAQVRDQNPCSCVFGFFVRNVTFPFLLWRAHVPPSVRVDQHWHLRKPSCSGFPIGSFLTLLPTLPL